MAILRHLLMTRIGILFILICLTQARRDPESRPSGETLSVFRGLEGFFRQQQETFEEEEEYYSDDAFGGTASYFDALAETDSPGGNVEIFAEGNSESSLDLSSAEINLEAVANSDQEVYGYFSTDTISESLTGLQHQFVQGASLTELEAYGKGALLREDFRGRTFVDGTNTAANQKTKSVAKGTTLASAGSRVSIKTETP